MGYPLNAITLVPAAKAELYLVRPDGTPFADQTVTLRGGVYLEDNYCGEDVRMGPDSNSLVPGNTDGTYQTDGEGKLTVHMDATQFNADGYTGPLTNASLDYWFELRDLNGNQYYPVLVNVQGSMSADRILRTGSAVVVLEEVPDGEENKPYLTALEEVPDGEENKPYLTAQTLSYGEEDGSGELQVRNVLDSTGKVGPNSTYKYAELTSYFTLWGVDNDKGGVTVSMTGENGYAPEGQVVKDDTFPFASIPILTNTTVLTKATMTDSGWLEPETAESLRASVYQNGELVKQVTMPFQVIDLTEVEPVNVDATAVMVDMFQWQYRGYAWRHPGGHQPLVPGAHHPLGGQLRVQRPDLGRLQQLEPPGLRLHPGRLLHGLPADGAAAGLRRPLCQRDRGDGCRHL